MSSRSVLVVAHTGRPEAVRSAQLVIERLSEAGIGVRVLDGEADDIGCAGVEVMPRTSAAAEGAEVVMVLGGDGTLLRAADLARSAGTPLLGVNLGHVGFLAEAEREDLAATVDRVVTRRYDVEERMTIDVVVRRNGTVTGTTWALNEATVEKAERERMLEVVAEIDGRPLSNWGCDGVVCATPTGSTAYAFSAGGPVVWPEVEAMLVVPISAHSLFARPLVVSPRSVVAIEVLPDTPRAVLWSDGRRTLDLPPGARVEVRRGTEPVRLARLHLTPFTDRLVTKFGLPVTGWRGRVRQTAAQPAPDGNAQVEQVPAGGEGDPAAGGADRPRAGGSGGSHAAGGAAGTGQGR
ncbi:MULTISPECIES: NAD kinase [Actinomadura]|uniref:NAD kinase n=1 Tax=Actinomadura yumaensis TaxID=111807 RepID=A0ABW2CZK4_9ACTN|nr:NAD kinase [Actinomadura sp. J1-007]